MIFKHLVCTLALVLLIQTSSAAQTSATQESTKPEQQEARQALEQKAIALLDVVVADSQSLKPRNRLRLQIIAADMLWSRDEKRARALFEKSINDLNEIIGSVDYSDPNYYNLIQAPTQLFNEMLQILTQHDPQMALDFLHQTHLPLLPQQASSKFVDPSYELQMETQLANQIVEKDPKLSLKIGLESLDKGFSSNLISLLQQLQAKDRDGAAKLASALIKKLLTENLLLNNEASNVAIGLLGMASHADAHYVPANGKPVPSDSSTLIDAQSYRDLMDLTLNAALNSPTPSNPSDWRERNIAQSLLMGIKNLMPDVEKYAPSRVPMLQRKIADFNKNVNQSNTFWQDNQEVFQKGSVDDILGLVSKSSPEMRDSIYQQAAWKALGQDDSERARQIINDNISNPVSRHQMLDQLDRQIVSKQVEEGKIDQARLSLLRLRTNEDRATMLMQLANTLASKGDKKTALQLLDEARGLVGNKAENYAQMQVQLQIARSFLSLEPARSFEIVESLVAQFNELLSAAEVLNGFDQQYYKDGEMIWQGSTLSSMLGQFDNELGQFAHADFDRARDVAGRFQRLEARLMAQLSVARAALSNQQQGRDPIQFNRRVPIQMSGGYPFNIGVIVD